MEGIGRIHLDENNKEGLEVLPLFAFSCRLTLVFQGCCGSCGKVCPHSEVNSLCPLEVPVSFLLLRCLMEEAAVVLPAEQLSREHPLAEWSHCAWSGDSK